jgi:hypothetical protein
MKLALTLGFTLLAGAASAVETDETYIFLCNDKYGTVSCIAATKPRYDAGQADIAIPMTAQMAGAFKNMVNKKFECPAVTYLKRDFGSTNDLLLVYGLATCKLLSN